MSFAEELNKETNTAIKNIGEYLLTRDDLKDKLENPKKSLANMMKYIISEAKKLKVGECAMVDDETVYGWAVHYYDEDDLEINNEEIIHAKIATSNFDEEDEEEIVVSKQTQLKSKTKPAKKKQVDEEQLSLF